MNTQPNLTRLAWRVAPFLWGLAVVCVWVWTAHYEFATYADDNAASLQHWPEDSRLGLAADRPTLLFFMHPRCPCTRASVRELERTLTGAGLSEAQLPKCIVVASLPQDASDEWRDTHTLRSASALPRTEIVWDAAGVESSRFDAATSGAVRLFRADGELLFAGGVTASRGHEGDNAGGDRLRALLSQQTSTRQAPTPVFGCRLCVEPGTTDGGNVCLVSRTDEDPSGEGI